MTNPAFFGLHSHSVVKLRLISPNKGTNLLSTTLYGTYIICDFFKLQSVKKKSISADDHVQHHVMKVNPDFLNDELVFKKSSQVAVPGWHHNEHQEAKLLQTDFRLRWRNR